MDGAVTIRDERDDDTTAVDLLVGAAFDGRPNEVELVRGLRAGEPRALSRVAVHDGEVVGHAMLSRLRLEGSDINVLGLAPVAVAAHHQGQGIGKRLTEDAVTVAERSGAVMVVVLGDPAFYGRFGFEPAAAHGIAPPLGVAPGAFLVARLSSYDDTISGRIAYPAIFNDTGTL